MNRQGMENHKTSLLIIGGVLALFVGAYYAGIAWGTYNITRQDFEAGQCVTKKDAPFREKWQAPEEVDVEKIIEVGEKSYRLYDFKTRYYQTTEFYWRQEDDYKVVSCPSEVITGD